MKKRIIRKKQRRMNLSDPLPLTSKQLLEGSRFFFGKECLLCGEPATRMGVFRPERKLATVLGEPPGKIRQFAYGICNDCMHHSDYPKRVEEIILNDALSRVSEFSPGSLYNPPQMPQNGSSGV